MNSHQQNVRVALANIRVPATPDESVSLATSAICCGFTPEGGNRDHHRAVFADRFPLAQATVVLMLNRFVFAENVERRIARSALLRTDGSSREVRILGMGMMSWYGRRRP